MFIQLHRHSNVILIVGLKEKTSNPNEMEYTFYLVFIKHVSIDENSADETPIDNASSSTPISQQNPGQIEIPKMFLRVITLIEFDTFVATHGPGTSVVRKMDGELHLLLFFNFLLYYNIYLFYCLHR